MDFIKWSSASVRTSINTEALVVCWSGAFREMDCIYKELLWSCWQLKACYAGSHILPFTLTFVPRSLSLLSFFLLSAVLFLSHTKLLPHTQTLKRRWFSGAQVSSGWQVTALPHSFIQVYDNTMPTRKKTPSCRGFQQVCPKFRLCDTKENLHASANC